MAERLRQEVKRDYLRLASRISEELNYFGVPHVLVGGVISSQITPETRIGEVDWGNRVFTLENTVPLDMIRDDRTKRDVDIVAFCPDKDYLKGVEKWLRVEFPGVPISLEGVRFPDWPSRKKLTQFVVGTDFDGKGGVTLTFDDINQTIDPQTVEPWTMRTAQGDISVFNPITHFYRYLTRVPSGVKKKDLKDNKMRNLANLAWDFIGKSPSFDEAERLLGRYEGWKNFIKRITNFKELDYWTDYKSLATHIFWSTKLGEWLGNGRGFIGGKLSKFGNRFTG